MSRRAKRKERRRVARKAARTAPAAFGLARDACSVAGPQATAREYGIDSDNPEVIASGYARAAFHAAAFNAARAGALEGFRRWVPR
jgi:hypothetical protein